MNRADLMRLTRGGGGPPVTAPGYLTLPFISGEARVGEVMTAHSPTPAPGSVISAGPVWFYDDLSPVGVTADTFIPASGDATKRVYLWYQLSRNGQTLDVVSQLSDEIAPAVVGAPIITNQQVAIGRDTRAGVTFRVVNTGGMVTSMTIHGGNEAGHFLETGDGGFSVTVGGQGALVGTTILDTTFTGPGGAVRRNITVDTAPGAADVTNSAEMDGATALYDDLPVASPKTIWCREGFSENWKRDWFVGTNSNKRLHQSELTIKARVRRAAAFTGLGVTASGPNSYRLTDINNIRFEGMVFDAKFLRRSMGPQGVFLWEGTLGKVTFKDCDLRGNLASLPPGYSFWGFVYMSASATNVQNLELLFEDCDIHGVERLILAAGVPAGTALAPGPKITIRNCDCYDCGLDFISTVAGWQDDAILLDKVRCHSPYIDKTRISFGSGAGNVWKRSAAWTGAANGKKLLLDLHIDFHFNSSGTIPRTIYAEGGAATPTLEIWRETTALGAKLRVTVRDTAGDLIADLTSANPYGSVGATGVGGTAQCHLILDIDTDRDVRVHLWKERDLGGGEWLERLQSAPLSGQLLNLTAGEISFSGRYDGTRSSSGLYSYIYLKRFAVWYGQALANDAARNAFISDVSGYIADWADVQAIYGDPTVWMEGGFNDWNTLGNRMSATRGQWTTKPNAATLGHGDLYQSQFKTTVRGGIIRDSIFFGGADFSPKYDRPHDMLRRFVYPEMQALFQEDQNSNNYIEGWLYENVLMGVASGYALGLFNGKDCVIDRLAAFILDDWGFGTSNYPTLRNRAHGSAPLAGNCVFRNSLAYAMSSEFASDVFEGSNVTGNAARISVADTPATLDAFLAYAVAHSHIQDVGQ